MHPIAIHPVELARMGAVVNPTTQMDSPLITGRAVPQNYNPDPSVHATARYAFQNGTVGRRPF